MIAANEENIMRTEFWLNRRKEDKQVVLDKKAVKCCVYLVSLGIRSSLDNVSQKRYDGTEKHPKKYIVSAVPDQSTEKNKPI